MTQCRWFKTCRLNHVSLQSRTIHVSLVTAFCRVALHSAEWLFKHKTPLLVSSINALFPFRLQVRLSMSYDYKINIINGMLMSSVSPLDPSRLCCSWFLCYVLHESLLIDHGSLRDPPSGFIVCSAFTFAHWKTARGANDSIWDLSMNRGHSCYPHLVSYKRYTRLAISLDYTNLDYFTSNQTNAH